MPLKSYFGWPLAKSQFRYAKQRKLQLLWPGQEMRKLDAIMKSYFHSQIEKMILSLKRDSNITIRENVNPSENSLKSTASREITSHARNSVILTEITIA